MKQTLDHSTHHPAMPRFITIGSVGTLFTLNFALLLLLGRSIYFLAPVVSVQVYVMAATFIVSSVAALLAIRGLRCRWSERRTAAYILLAVLWLPVAPLVHMLMPDRFSYIGCLNVQEYVFPLTPCGGDPGFGHHHLHRTGLHP